MGMIRSVLFGKGNFASDRPYGQEHITRIDAWISGGFICGLQVRYARKNSLPDDFGKPNTLHGDTQGEPHHQVFDEDEQIVAAVAFKWETANHSEEGICGLILQTTRRTVRFGHPTLQRGSTSQLVPETLASVNPDCFEVVGNIKGFYTAWNDGMPLRQIGFLFNDEVLRSSYAYNDRILPNQAYTIGNVRAGQGQLRLAVVERQGNRVLALLTHPAPAGTAVLASEFYFETAGNVPNSFAIFVVIDGAKAYVRKEPSSDAFTLGASGQSFSVTQRRAVPGHVSGTLAWMATHQWYITDGNNDGLCLSVGDGATLAWGFPEQESASEWIIAAMPS